MFETIKVDAALGDRVWIDANGNGLQDKGNGPLDPGEVGLNGVTVKLLDLDGSLVAETVTTNGPADAPGYYTFEDIDFSLPQGPNIRVAPPRYLIEFEAPQGFSFTKQDADPAQYLVGESPIDSDVDPKTGRLETGPLSPTGVPGAQIFTLDAGLVPNKPNNKKGIVGDRLWNDLNKNGLQDKGESGINGVTVNLFNLAGDFIARTKTANNAAGEAGYYRFENLNSGSSDFNSIPFEIGESYTVEVDLPRNYTFTLQNADPRLAFETDSALDSDADRSTGRFTTFPLTNLIGGISPVQLYWDAGLIKIDQFIQGSADSDKLLGRKTVDEINGGDGHDLIFGRQGGDVLVGGQGNDRLNGNAGKDLLIGGDGNDRLRGSYAKSLDKTEYDVLQGGDGRDRFFLGNRNGAFYDNGESGDQALVVDFIQGEDLLYLHGGIGDYRVESNFLADQLFLGKELIATVNRTFFADPIQLETDARFLS